MPAPPEIAALLARVNTALLARPNATPTVALVVFNFADAPVSPCRVRFAAAFPASEEKPVTVRDDCGVVVPSRLVESTLTEKPGLAAGKRWWSLVLEFDLVAGVAGRTGRAFGASYEVATVPPLSPSEKLRFSGSPFPPSEGSKGDEEEGAISVYETDIHSGDLPTTFSLPTDVFPAPLSDGMITPRL